MMKSKNLDYAIIGNCTTAAILDKDGTIGWSCWPSFEDDPLFSGFLNQDETGRFEIGKWQFELKDFSHSEQFYQKNTAIVETHLYSHDGSALKIIDFMPRFIHYGRPFRDRIIIRMIEPLCQTPMVNMTINPTYRYGEKQYRKVVSSNHIVFAAPEQKYRMTSDAPLSALEKGHQFLVDKPFHFVFGANETIAEDLRDYCQSFYHRTHDYWTNFTKHLSIPPEWQEAVIRACITLKLCTYEETGAIVAALTTSIPEAKGSIRNWDYRYCWLRDSYFTISALNKVNITDTMGDFLRFIKKITIDYREGDIQPLFTIHGGRDIYEWHAKSLQGFQGHQPVRIGNAAYSQIQNDSYGSIILALTQLFFDERLSYVATQDDFTHLEKFGERALQVWDKPDAGIWELRGSVSVRTFSATVCWAACDRLAKIAAHLGDDKKHEKWRGHADMMSEGILARAWNEEIGSFTESFDNDFIDASLLLMHQLGIIDPRDERYVKTVRKIGDTLMHKGLLYRYINEDDFGKAEVAFTICSFWYIEALYGIGEVDKARELFDSLLKKRNHVGLLSEDVDFDTGDLWGNFPQTYSMVGIINCAYFLSRRWDEIL